MAKGVTGSGIICRVKLEGVIGAPTKSICVGMVGENFIQVRQLKIGNARHVVASSKVQYNK